MIQKLLFLALIFGGSSATANVTLRGKVNLKGTRESISNVNVFLLPHRLKATTALDGRFEIPDVPSGPAQWVVNAQGYLRLEKNFEVTEAENPVFKLLLEPSQIPDYETTIQSTENQDLVLKSITRKNAASLPGAGLDPIRAVQNLPGVNRTQGFSSRVVIQGSAPEDTRYTLDGHEIPLIFHFGGLSSVFNPELSESFDFFSAGYQSTHGRAMGGVLNINSRNLSKSNWKGSVFVDVFNAGAEIEGPVGDQAQIAVGARVSYVGQVLKAVVKSNDNFSLTVAPSYSDLGLIYQTPFSDQLKFKLVMLASQDSLEFVANNPLRDDPALRGNFSNRISFFRVIPEWEWTHSARSKTVFSFGMGRDFIHVDIGEQFFDLKTVALTSRLENRIRLSDELTLASGMDHHFSWADVLFKLPVFHAEGGIFNPIASSTTKIANLKSVSSHLLGFYLNPIWKPASQPRWSFYPGVRLDYFVPLSEVKIGPRLGSRFAISPSLDFISAGGLYAQAPREQEYSSAYGNPNLKSSSAWHLKFALEKDLSEELVRGSKASTGFFGRWFQDLVIPDLQTVYSNLGKGKSFGWENSFETKINSWNFWAIYTLSRSTRSDPKHREYLYPYDQTHFLTLIAAVDLARNWRISGRFRYVTGPIDTLPTGAVSDLDHDVFIPIRGDLYNVRLNAFSMLDLRIDKRWLYDAWTLSLYLDIQNVLNRQNSEGIQYSYDYQKTDTIKGIPILPTFGLKGEF